MATKKKATPVNGWNPAWLVANAPAGTIIPGAGVATGPAATPPPATPPPPDPALDAATLAGNRNVAISQGESAYQTGNLGFDYGYNPDGTVNTANPYSRAAMFQLAHDNQRRGNTNSLAAQGQLYAGSLVNAQNATDQNYAQNDAANRLAYQRGLHGIQTNQLSTAANAGTSVSGADWNALLKSTYPGS